jgi:hypothetical protein
MSILIKGVEMPKGDEMLCINICPDGKVYIDFDLKCKRIATAVPVPPHGRLIDADALMLEFDKAQRTMQQHGQEYSCSFMSSSREISTEWYCVEDMVENAPTIIEAEEETHGD